MKLVDKAGNRSTNEIQFTRDYSGLVDGPIAQVTWPPANAVLSGDTFSIRGTVADPTARVIVSFEENEEVKEVEGMVDVDGNFWINQVPLPFGTTQFTVRFVNAVNLASVFTFSVTRGDAIITIPEGQPTFDLPTGFVSISGTIAENANVVSITVNGETVDIDGLTWSREDLLMSEEGVMVFDFVIDRSGDLPTLYISKEFEVPTHIRVRSFTMTSTEKHDNNFGGSARYERTRNVTWTHGSGGSYKIEIRQPDENGAWDLSYGEEIKWDAKGVGLHSVLVGGEWSAWSSTLWDADSTPPVQSSLPIPGPPKNSTAHRWVNYKFVDNWEGELQPGQSRTDEYVEKAHGNLELRVGGRPQAKNQSIVRLTLGAAGELPYPYFGNVNEDNQRKPFAAKDVSVLGYSFADNGELYMPVQDGLKQAFKPKTPGAKAFVAPIAGEQKHSVKIKLNGIPLHGNSKEEIVVGQMVSLSATIDPPSPALKIRSSEWGILGVAYVNRRYFRSYTRQHEGAFWQENYGSEIFELDPSKLQTPSTSLWFINGGSASILQQLVVETGTEVLTVEKSGEISVKEPTAVWVPPPQNPAAGHPEFRAWPDGIHATVSLGERDGDFDFEGDFKFIGSPPPSGEVMLTQLCQLDYRPWSIPSAKFLNEPARLDHSEAYSFGIVGISNDKIHFEDGPEFTSTPPPLHLKGNFKVFVRYKPLYGTPDDNIFVTIVTMDWGVDAIFQQFEPETWVRKEFIGPTFSLSNEFPLWEKSWP